MKNFFKKYSIQIKLFIPLLIGLITLSSILYYLIPMILNYPEGTWGTTFQREVENTDYLTQIIEISGSIFAIFVITTFSQTHFLIRYKDLINNPSNHSIDELNKLKNKLFTSPNKLYLLNVIIPSIALTIIHAYTIHQLGITTLKLFILVFSIIILYVSATYIYTNGLFKRILIHLPGDDLKHIKRSSMHKTILYNIGPIFFASLLFIALLGYSKLASEKGDSLFTTYKTELSFFSKDNNFTSIDDMLSKAKDSLTLDSESDYIFIQTDSNSFMDINKKKLNMSNFFVKYLNEMSDKNDGRVYEYYGVDCQAATEKIYINNTEYTIGIYYYILYPSVLAYFAIVILILLVINYITLSLFSRSISDDITIISNRFNQISNSKSIDKNNTLSLTSNTEIGDLIISYNRIQDLTALNIKQIEQTKDTLMEQERLASLGQMIGGISHNLKTPIFSIAGGIEGLNDLIDEFDKSIDNEMVTNEDMHDIAKDMYSWTSKIKDYTSYMSDIITAVKGQAVNFSNDSIDYFTTTQLFKYVDLLMKHELKNSLTELIIENNVDENIFIQGNINGLVQVINNIISNAIQSYTDQPNKSIILAANIKNNKLLISIQDFGSGMSKEIQDKLFKEMITTKGKNGTGLGLFMSYSNIKAHYNGNMYFESELGKGTTFYIELPIENKNKI